MEQDEQKPIYLYRWERKWYTESTSESWNPEIELVKHLVLRQTEHYFFIKHPQYPSPGSLKEKRVKRLGKKKYAYLTPEAAFKNFKARTKTCIRILKANLRAAKGYSSIKEMPDVESEQ